MLIELLKDPSVVVRDTAAWTVGRVCEIIPDAVITETYLNPLLEALVEGLTAEPRVATNVCWVCGMYIYSQKYKSVCWICGQGCHKCCLYIHEICLKLQAFSSLAEAAFEAAEIPDDQTEPETYTLSGCFEAIVHKLLETTDRFVLLRESDILMLRAWSNCNCSLQMEATSGLTEIDL